MSYVRKNLGREARLSAATRAFGVSSSGSLTPDTGGSGSPSIGDAGCGLPILSVGGSAGAEQAAISFTVE